MNTIQRKRERNRFFLYRACLLLTLLSIVGCATVKADYDNARKAGTKQAYTLFLAKHPDSEYDGAARNAIIDVDWQDAVNKNTKQGFTDFRKNHPNSVYDDQIDPKIEAIIWTATEKANTIKAYRTFLEQYPIGENADRCRSALAALCEKNWQETLQKNSIDSYNAFAIEWPWSDHVNEIEGLINAVKENSDYAKLTPSLENYRGFLEKWPDTTHRAEVDKAINGLDNERWGVITKGGKLAAYENYARDFPKGLHITAAQDSIESISRANSAMVKIEEIEKALIDELKTTGTKGRATLPSALADRGGTYCVSTPEDLGGYVKISCVYPNDFMMFPMSEFFGDGSDEAPTYEHLEGSVQRIDGTYEGGGYIIKSGGDKLNMLTFVYLEGQMTYLRGKGTITKPDGELIKLGF